MIALEQFKKLALSFPYAEELPHFEKASFRINGKIFATLDAKNKRACLKLSLINQSVFSDFDKSNIYPVPNAWGKKGWTFFELDGLREDMMLDALGLAIDEISKAKK